MNITIITTYPQPDKEHWLLEGSTIEDAVRQCLLLDPDEEPIRAFLKRVSSDDVRLTTPLEDGDRLYVIKGVMWVEGPGGGKRIVATPK